ncbi:MAG: helix-turn-helix domain-containing protein [Anaerolineae bacterium]|nr:helix-turn-helix domain-containing protein [Anaerolineae bacterium]
MPKIISIRALSEEEAQVIEKLSRSRTAAKREVDRAMMIKLRAEGLRPGQIGQRLGYQPDSVTRWVKRFNTQGVSGLQEVAGRGRKANYSQQVRGAMVALAKTRPEQVGQPFSCWSIRLLVDYLHTVKGIPVSRAQLARILEAEGVVWYQEQTYFTERPDPQFAEKRGR